MKHLTICWLTSRENCCFDWFCDSLHRETAGNYHRIKVVAIDFLNQPLDERGHTEEDVEKRRVKFKSIAHRIPDFLHTVSKPSVWQGQHRQCKNSYFCAAGTRNTGLCYAPDGHIAYVDDLSVLLPGWIKAVRESMKRNYIACGAFRKVKNLVVKNGSIISFSDHPGYDSRWNHGKDTEAVPCPAQWLFGCSVAGPVNAFLSINGWPEACDSTGIGCEDCMTGLALEASGYKLKYDRRMLTYESEELHHIGHKMLRVDLGNIGFSDSKSHELVRMLTGKKWFDNDFRGMSISELRRHVLSGKPFPMPPKNAIDWYNGKFVKDL